MFLFLRNTFKRTAQRTVRRSYVRVQTRSRRAQMTFASVALGTFAAVATTALAEEQQGPSTPATEGMRTSFSMDQLEARKEFFYETYPDGMDEQTFTGFLSDHPSASFLFRALDQEKKGVIGVQEWLMCAALFAVGTPEERLEFQFKVFDLNEDGSITVDELTKIIKAQLRAGNIPMSALNHHEHLWQIGRRTPEDLSHDLITACDLNHDNKITLDEFQCLADELVKLNNYKEVAKIKYPQVKVDKDFLNPGTKL